MAMSFGLSCRFLKTLTTARYSGGAPYGTLGSPRFSKVALPLMCWSVLLGSMGWVAPRSASDMCGFQLSTLTSETPLQPSCPSLAGHHTSGSLGLFATQYDGRPAMSNHG